MTRDELEKWFNDEFYDINKALDKLEQVDSIHAKEAIRELRHSLSDVFGEGHVSAVQNVEDEDYDEDIDYDEEDYDVEEQESTNSNEISWGDESLDSDGAFFLMKVSDGFLIHLRLK